MPESSIMRRVQVMASKLGARIFRNHVGMGWTGATTQPSHAITVTVYPGDVVIRNARPLKSGLCVGSSDLIGWKTVQIGQNMVGKCVAIFTAIEVKTEDGKVTPEQENFIAVVRKAGGIAFVARSEQELRDLFEGATNVRS